MTKINHRALPECVDDGNTAGKLSTSTLLLTDVVPPRTAATSQYVRFLESNRNDLLTSIAQYDSIVYGDNNISEDAPVITRVSQTVNRSFKLPPASGAVIGDLPRTRVLPVHQNHALNRDDLCGICCDKLTDGIVLLKLPCGHIYHLCCIVPWLRTCCTCPECRYELPTNDPIHERDRQERMKSYDTSRCNCGVVHNCFFQMPNDRDLPSLVSL
jgi:hypothetical protein